MLKYSRTFFSMVRLILNGLTFLDNVFKIINLQLRITGVRYHTMNWIHKLVKHSECERIKLRFPSFVKEFLEFSIF